ncbi:PREDICTED: uncharacterized protein LOC101385344 [Odobenus rosmarus divergens]|uniref:Uncharacterized protein LOC101385344 n=1 Tax=Odobenus rosmarus divergens TaxID=9708 RepID=A0A9B0H8D8_ODORO
MDQVEEKAEKTDFQPAQKSSVTLTGNRPRPEKQAASGESGPVGGGPQAGFLEPRLHGRLHPDTGQIRGRLHYQSPAARCPPALGTARKAGGQWAPCEQPLEWLVWTGFPESQLDSCRGWEPPLTSATEKARLPGGGGVLRPERRYLLAVHGRHC